MQLFLYDICDSALDSHSSDLDPRLHKEVFVTPPHAHENLVFIHPRLSRLEKSVRQCFAVKN